MSSKRAIRYQGTVTTWKDEQGFGFIAPNGGGAAVFVHIKSFAGRGVRPAAGTVVTYELTLNAQGQSRAENVAHVRARGAPAPATGNGRGSISIVLALGFGALLAGCTIAGMMPAIVPGACLALSLTTFIAYAIDKSAARNNARRTPESTLHLLALLGGWPGALIAQQLLRHKSKKAAFRRVCWATVVVNCLALGWLLSGAAANLTSTP